MSGAGYIDAIIIIVIVIRAGVGKLTALQHVNENCCCSGWMCNNDSM